MVWCVRFAEAVPVQGGCVVAIGNFDGVHEGHRHLLALARAEAQWRHLPLVVLTFEPHPRSILRPEVPLKRLTTPEEKVERLAFAEVDGVAVVEFSLDVAGWSPEQFIDDVLIGWLGAKGVCVGENFRFGHKARGDVATLKADGRFAVLAVPLLADEQGVVSSSRLRLS